MANITISSAARDYQWWPDLFETGEATPTITRSPTSVVVSWTSAEFGAIRIELAGTGITYGVENRPITGTVNAMTVSVAGQVWLTATALGLPVADIDHLWFGFQRPDRYQDGNPFNLFTFLLSGNDVIFGSAKGDDIFPGRNPGNDTIYAGGGDDFIKADMGNDVIFGGRDFDTYSLTETFFDPLATQGAVVNLATGVATDSWGGTDTISQIERVEGSRLNDRIVGSAANEQLIGLKGNDTLNGGAGNDEVRYDRDVRYGGSLGVNVNLATGVARDGWGNTDTLRNIENVRGTAANDVLTGNDANNWLHGGAGVDRIDGGAGSDGVNMWNDGVTAGAVVNLSLATAQVSNDGFGNVETLTGIENIGGTFRNDALTGNALVNEIFGSGGQDTIRAGQGDDRIEGGAGSDSLTGGLGADRFVFKRDDGNLPFGDTITDFASGVDKIDFRSTDFGGPATGVLFRNGSSAGSAGQPWLFFEAATNRLFWDSDGTGGTAPVLVATLSGVTTMAAGDFLFS